jgi:hypothetical protein
MKAAPGAGIVSSFVMESDDLDEIDWVRNNQTIIKFISLTIPIGMDWKRCCASSEQLLWQGKHHNL